MAPETWYGIGAAVLLLGLIYGWFRHATRRRSRARTTQSATSILYNSRMPDDAAEPPALDEPAKRYDEHQPPGAR